MTVWDVLDRLLNSFPPIIMALILLAVFVAVVILIVGFSRHGFNFLKYGFKQIALDSSLEKRFDKLEAKIESIEVNHFGHLKNYLSELTSILVDKNVLNITDKTRLDNHLRGM